MPSLGTYIMNLSLLRKRIPIIMESKVIPILDLEGKRKKSHLSLSGSSFIGRNVKVGAAKRPDPEFIENGVLGTGQAEII